MNTAVNELAIRLIGDQVDGVTVFFGFLCQNTAKRGDAFAVKHRAGGVVGRIDDDGCGLCRQQQTERKMKSMSYIWPMVLLVVSNTVYQLCAKSVPKGINPFASLIVTYLIGAAASLVLYFVLGSDGNLLKEYGKLNWAPFVLGIVIVGLEAGWIYAYKAGWQVSTGFIVQSAFLAMSLLLVGYFIFREALTWNKVVGVAICLVGLIFINLK